MKLARNLLLGGGAVLVLFVAFHVWLGWRLHHLARLDPGIRSLLELLNGGGALFLAFLAAAALGFADEVLASRLGRFTLAFAATLFLLRGLAEFVVPPQASPVIVGTCLVTAAVFGAVLLLARRAGRPPPTPATPVPDGMTSS